MWRAWGLVAGTRRALESKPDLIILRKWFHLLTQRIEVEPPHLLVIYRVISVHVSSTVKLKRSLSSASPSPRCSSYE